MPSAQQRRKVAVPVEIAADAAKLLARHGHPGVRVFDVDSECHPTVIVFTEGAEAKTALVSVTPGKTTVEVEEGWSL